MTFNTMTSNVPQDLGAPIQLLHDIHNFRTHCFPPQSPSSIALSTRLREILSIGHLRVTTVRVSRHATGVKTEPSAGLDLTNVEFSSLPSGLHLVEEDVVCE